MCGIAGFELGQHDAERAEALLRRLRNRGPDGGWFSRVPPYGLVQTRLAVIDLSSKLRYPLANERGDLHLLFNGEIFAYEQHLEMLAARGHRFSSRCDAEVLLHGYEEWGDSVFTRIDGMFAAALLDGRTGDLLLVRDALGIKPLTYATSRPFAFASDSLALIAAGFVTGDILEHDLTEYLFFHYLAPTRTAVRDLAQLAPGELLRRSRDGSMSISRWAPRPFSMPPDPAGVTSEEFEAAFDRSVRRQLVADVPVGVFLSSGVDSSLILDTAVRSGARPIAFTIGFRGHGDYDESNVAARFAQHVGVRHEAEELAGGFVETVERVCEHFDQPLGDASAIATAQLAALARRHVTVALSGTGGDDLFAGYYRHRAHSIARILRHVPPSVFALLARLPEERGAERRSMLALWRSYIRRLALLDASDGFAQYLGLLVTGHGAHRYLLSSNGSAGPTRRVDVSPSPSTTVLRRIQAYELASYLPGDLLPKEDRTTMAVGLEGRVPLLGNDLLRIAECATDEQKITLRSGKLLLRQLARKRLPPYIFRARKRGFAVPLAHLLGGPWRAEATDWFAGTTSELVDLSQVRADLTADRLAPDEAWALAVLGRWEQRVGEARQSARTLGL
jgi:asparagine synthase (glutamine-hydrolysing)